MSRIAIIGFQGRFPGDAKSSAELFEQLLAAESFCRDVPADRWSKPGYVTKDLAAGKTPVGRGAFLDYDYRGFDPDIFALSADEISFLDPQQRLVLEVAWEALEQAAIDPHSLSGEAVGVYVGGFTTDHLLNQFSAPARSALGRFSAAGTTLTMLANRLSYALDLRGPSFTVDTACASSLTALAAAVRDLQAGACRMALAGGVSFMLRPEYQIAMSAAGLLAVDGRSKPFSNLADGYGRGEGCGMLVLKPLADARADKDRIWAVVEAIGTGHGGRTAGISLPNGQAQADLMRHVLAESELAPGDIGYVEAHGTGTMQGDRIEARSIGAVYGRVERSGALPIGSIKANIGHLEAAAGVAGVIKALLILQAGRIPPHLLVGQPNPDIPFDALNLRLARDPEPLSSRYVAVNAFGYGGSNAHAILGRPPDPAVPPKDVALPGGAVMLPLSAQSAEALSGWRARLSEQVEAGVPLADLRYTLARRRGHRPFRSAVWVDADQPPASIAERIRAPVGADSGLEGRNRTESVPKALFVFSGMGPQWAGMGRSLWATEPVFRETVEELDAVFRSVADLSLIEAMTEAQEGVPLRGCRVAQPLNFAFQVGLVRLLRSYGLEADICLGHSAGEVAAAYCAGHLPLDQAVAVCRARSELQDERAGGGGMLVAAIGAREAQALCARAQGLEIAAFNSRRSVTFAGPESALSQAEAELKPSKIPVRRLDIDIAYHSADMAPILNRLEARLDRLEPVPPAVELVSSVTARPVSGRGRDRMDSAYWLRNVREPVRFHEALETAFGLGATHCIEIGARPVLRGAIAETASEHTQDATVIPMLDGGDDDMRAAFREALTRLYVTGGPLDWKRIAPAGNVATLPVTGWYRRPFWHEADVQALDRLRNAGASPWAEPSIAPRSWTADLNAEAFAFLGDHRIGGVALLPGTAALEAAFRTGLAVNASPGPALPAGLADIGFENPFPLNRKAGQMLASRHMDGALETLAYDPASPGEAIRVLRARIASPGKRPPARPIAELAGLAPHPLDAQQHRVRLAELGIDHGPSFQVVQTLSLAADGAAALAQLAINHPAGKEEDAQWAPCLLDGVFQAALALTVVCEPLVPVSIRAYALHAPLPRHLWAWITLREGGGDGYCFDATLHDSAGQCLARLEEIVVRPLTPHREAPPLPDMALVMEWRDAPAPPGRAERRRISVVASDPRERDRLCRALAAAGAEIADDRADATAVLVPEGPLPLADRMAELVALCTDPSLGRTYLITRNAQPVAAADFALPDQAAAWGLGRTLFNEVPETGTTMIDVAAGEAWHPAVAQEIAAPGPSSEIAFRGGRRLLPRLRESGLADSGSNSPHFHRSKAYLVTGGLGGFGRQLALWLAERGAGRIVLTSRSRPPRAGVAPLARELASRGAELVVAPVDLTDEPAVRTLLRTLSAESPLGGIFHWAGMTVDRAATDLTVDDLRNVLGPKADAADALHEASLDLALDHFVLASSLSSIVGNPRQANYAAANAFLDGLAWKRHSAGLPGLSVNFGAIAGTGMAASPAVIAHLKAAGLPAMSAASALAGLGAALASGLPQVSLSRAIDTERWMRYDPRCAATDKMSDLLAEARAAAATRRDIRAELDRLPAGRRPRRLADHLRLLLAEILKCPPDRLSRESALSRTGMDSLAAVEFQLAIDRDLGVALPITALIGGQTLAGIGARIARELADAGHLEPCKIRPKL